MSAVQLTVAIATTATRLACLDPATLPPVEGVRYLVLVQGDPPALPSHQARDDLHITRTEGIGAARSRNAALAQISTALLLFADDDLTFSAAGLRALIRRFEMRRGTDFLCARLSDETGQPRKRYSTDSAAVRWWNCGKVGTPELALRPAAFRDKDVTFDTRFGAGMPDHLGDEYIFLCDALRAGLRGEHAAIVVASHDGESSGTRQDPAGMEIRRRVLIRALGRWKSRPARMAFALRHWRRFSGWRARWRFIS